MQMRSIIFAAGLMAALASVPTFADDNSAAKHYTVADTEVGTLLDDPGARAVVDKHIPGFSKGDQIDMARSMTLAGLQAFAPDTFTDKVLAAIDADLAKLPPNK